MLYFCQENFKKKIENQSKTKQKQQQQQQQQQQNRYVPYCVSRPESCAVQHFLKTFIEDKIQQGQVLQHCVGQQYNLFLDTSHFVGYSVNFFGWSVMYHFVAILNYQ